MGGFVGLTALGCASWPQAGEFDQDEWLAHEEEVGAAGAANRAAANRDNDRRRDSDRRDAARSRDPSTDARGDEQGGGEQQSERGSARPVDTGVQYRLV